MTGPMLLSRDAFREAVFARDHHTCVCCEKPAVDAHHLIERRLWPDGGYYLDNGASVCEEHHLAAERTTLSVEDLRQAAGITKTRVPPHLYPDQPIDKWGNPVMANGQRLKGELFFDASVQKVLGEGGVLGLFTDEVKYPRTHHLPWSEGMHDDDRMLPSIDVFARRRVIVTEKMDGENTTLYRHTLHARSVDGRSHPSRNWVKGFWSQVCGDIPEGWRVCGENLYAKHSIGYDNLPSYFMAFSIWDERNACLPWDETLEWLDLLGMTPVPVLYDGPFDAKVIQSLYGPKDWGQREGYVVRVADGFSYGAFRDSVAKFVRRGHVQTNKHWMHGQPIVPNELADPALSRPRPRQQP
jgi:hypothetical protein